MWGLGGDILRDILQIWSRVHMLVSVRFAGARLNVASRSTLGRSEGGVVRGRVLLSSFF